MNLDWRRIRKSRKGIAFGLLGKGSGAFVFMKKLQSGVSASRNLETLSDLCKYLAKLSNKQVKQTRCMR